MYREIYYNLIHIIIYIKLLHIYKYKFCVIFLEMRKEMLIHLFYIRDILIIEIGTGREIFRRAFLTDMCTEMTYIRTKTANVWVFWLLFCRTVYMLPSYVLTGS